MTGCPREQLTRDAYLALAAADMAEKGVLPLAGGWMDQTQQCLQAVLFVWHDEAEYRAARGG